MKQSDYDKCESELALLFADNLGQEDHWQDAGNLCDNDTLLERMATACMAEIVKQNKLVVEDDS